MWALVDTGFISVVEHREDPNVLLVRSRVREDITRTFGTDIEIEELPGADYLFRAKVDRQRVADTMWEKVMTLDYDSHVKDVAIKRSAPSAGRSAAYYATWTAMAQMQPYAPYAHTPRSATPPRQRQAVLPLADDYDDLIPTPDRSGENWLWRDKDDQPLSLQEWSEVYKKEREFQDQPAQVKGKSRSAKRRARKAAAKKKGAA
jgi:hypothetical protein